MRYPHRCNRCRKRFTLKRLLTDYVIPRKCPRCGTESITLDKWIYRERLNRKGCRCDGYAFPHRLGSGVWCIHSKERPTEKDYAKRYGER